MYGKYLHDLQIRKCEGVESMRRRRVWSNEADSRPSLSFGQLIYQVLLQAGHPIPISEIYTRISHNYPYYDVRVNGWKNSVRHALSASPHFTKVPMPSHEKRFLWTLNDLMEKSEIDIIDDYRVHKEATHFMPTPVSQNRIKPKAKFEIDQMPYTDLQYTPIARKYDLFMTDKQPVLIDASVQTPSDPENTSTSKQSICSEPFPSIPAIDIPEELNLIPLNSMFDTTESQRFNNSWIFH